MKLINNDWWNWWIGFESSFNVSNWISLPFLVGLEERV